MGQLERRLKRGGSTEEEEENEGMGRRAKKEKEISQRRKTFSSSYVLPSLVIKGVGPFSFCSYTGEHLPHPSLNMKSPLHSSLTTTKLQQ